VLRFKPILVEQMACFALALMALTFVMVTPTVQAAVEADRPKAASGQTQVIAKIGKREITTAELRVEIMRLGIRDVTVDTERFALQSIINRHLLVEAAKDANVHRKPDAALRMRAASDQALADFFLGSASQAAEPTLSEIEDYIAANPGLFANRMRYEFLVISLPTDFFDVDAHTPLFSETANFTALKAHFDTTKVPYAEKPLVQASSSFAREIREQLALYSVNDNIIIKSDNETQIMKIRKEAPSPLPSDDWRAVARRLVMEQNAVNRARSLIDSLKVGSSVTFYRPDLAPKSVKKPKPTKPSASRPSKSTGK